MELEAEAKGKKERGNCFFYDASRGDDSEKRMCANTTCSSICTDVSCCSYSAWYGLENKELPRMSGAGEKSHETCPREIISFDQYSRAETSKSGMTLKTIAETISIVKEWSMWAKCFTIDVCLPLLSKTVPSFFKVERHDTLVNREILLKSSNSSNNMTKRKHHSKPQKSDQHTIQDQLMGVAIDQNVDSSNQIDVLNSMLDTELGPMQERNESSPPTSSLEAPYDSEDAVALSEQDLIHTIREENKNSNFYQQSDMIDFVSESMSSISCPSFGDTYEKNDTHTKVGSEDIHLNVTGNDSLLSYDDIITAHTDLGLVGMISFESMDRSISGNRGIEVLNDLCDDGIKDSESFDSLGNKKKKLLLRASSGYEASDGSDTDLSAQSSFSMSRGTKLGAHDDYSLD